MPRHVILVTALCMAASASVLDAVTILGVERYGEFQPVGTLLSYDSNAPKAGTVIGQTGITHVGAIDFYQGRLWAASSAGGILSFWQINPQTAQAIRVSTAGSHSQSYVFGGSFDEQGRFWVTDLGSDTLASYNPWTGQRLSVAPILPELVITGLAFIGPKLYAISTTQGGPGYLGTLETDTGIFNPINYGLSVGGSNGLDYDPVGGKLYSTYPTSNPGSSAGLQEIVPLTGEVTRRVNLDPDATLDAIAVVPEPAGLFLLALAGAAVLRKQPAVCGRISRRT